MLSFPGTFKLLLRKAAGRSVVFLVALPLMLSTLGARRLLPSHLISQGTKEIVDAWKFKNTSQREPCLADDLQPSRIFKTQIESV